MALATTVDYMDTHANNYQRITGRPPPDNMTFSKIHRNITPTILWSGAQYYLNNYKLGGKIAVVEPHSYTP
eukprot:5852818-Karenia_brevis.AAC.1